MTSSAAGRLSCAAPQPCYSWQGLRLGRCRRGHPQQQHGVCGTEAGSLRLLWAGMVVDFLAAPMCAVSSKDRGVTRSRVAVRSGGATGCARFAGLARQAWALAPRPGSLRTSLAEDGRLFLSNSTQVWERRGAVFMTGEGIRRSPASAALTGAESATWVAPGAACLCQPTEQPVLPQWLAAGTMEQLHVGRTQERAPEVKRHWSAFLCQPELIPMQAQQSSNTFDDKSPRWPKLSELSCCWNRQ